MRRCPWLLLPLLASGPLALVPAVPAASAAVTATATPAVPAALAVPAAPAAVAGGHATPRATAPAAGFVYYNGGTPGTSPGTYLDTAGGAVSVNWLGPGLYLVYFPNLAARFTGGDFQVSPATSGATCALGNSAASSGGVEVVVDCYDASGTAANAAFGLLLTQPQATPAGVFDYARTTSLAGSGKLTGQYQYNSSHKANSVAHVSAGHYVVTMPGPKLAGANTGTVKVSPVGTGGGSCQIASLAATATGERVGVDCFSATGTAQDRLFTVAYARGNNLLGMTGEVTANAYVPGSGTASIFQPVAQYDSKAGAKITALHLGTGLYEVVFAGSNPTGHQFGGAGHLEVTPVGTAYRRCSFSAPSTHVPYTFVQCVTGSSTPVNAAFTVQWVVN